ncbi:MAG: hypothetical protein ING75_05550 [Rhodocyclaceae bacterium]|nr:hypothetical protein [Rhodocyclaceae bacterium]
MKDDKSFTLLRALSVQIGRLNQPIVTSYHIGLMVFAAYRTKLLDGTPLLLKKADPTRQQFTNAMNQLLSTGIVTSNPSARSYVFSILGRSNVAVSETVCSVDPFCYVSHLSAMEFHGLTDRLPRTLIVSTPPSPAWRGYAFELMKKDLGPDYELYIEAGFPRLKRVHPEKISGEKIEYVASTHMGAYKNVQGQTLRVATMGRTFLDMLRKPELCGGMQHVIDVFQQSAKNYLRLIGDELDLHGNSIEKVRAGYILSELCSIQDERVNSWKRFAQRGGSRKLDPNAEYSSTFSAEWCLSLNLPSLERNASN